MNQRVDRGEALLSLVQVETNTSFRAAESIVGVVKTLDPHSPILQRIELGKTKLNYLSTYGLGEFQIKQLKRKCKMLLLWFYLMIPVHSDKNMN